MAYFLDPELAALATNAPRVPQQRTAATAADNRRKNKFGKSCHKCQTWVKAEKGYLDRVGGTWVVYCSTCP
jgi:hypothetical protein